MITRSLSARNKNARQALGLGGGSDSYDLLATERQ